MPSALLATVPPSKSKKGEGDKGRIALTISGITKTLGLKRTLFKDVDLSMYYGAKIGILGINGSGKSSLLKIIAGEDDDYEGTVRFAPGLKVGYLAQEPDLDEDLTVEENILEGVEEQIEILDRFEELEEELAEEGKLSKEEAREFESLKKEIQDKGIKNLKGKIGRAMDALRCPPGDSSVVNLSGGEKRRVALCRTLIANPDFLILDEPTNHLDAESVGWLENFLANFRGTVLAVTHDRYFLDNVAGWILEIDRGETYPFQGNYTEWLDNKARRLELQANKEAAFQRLLKRELQWINSPAKARQAKNKARIARYEEMLDRNKREKFTPGTIIIPPGPRLGKVVISVKNLSKSYNGRTLFENVSFLIPPGSVVGIVGPNGSGKSTLFRILTGEETPDEGHVEFGSTVRLGYITQNRDALEPGSTVFEEISEGMSSIPVGDQMLDARSYVAGFAFKGSDQSKLVGHLSGGERNRVHLAKMIKNAPNVLLLDEPTNDLDLEVLRKLEESIEEFAGVAVIVSHDRWFLDRLCTHIIAFEPDSNVIFFDGNYTDYLANRTSRLGIEGKPKRFKKLGV